MEMPPGRVRVHGDRLSRCLDDDDPGPSGAALLPSQIRDNVTLPGPEIRLLAAVLDQAIQDFCAHRRATDHAGRRLFASVQGWFASGDADFVCSFVNVCQALSMDPEAVRAQLRSLRSVSVSTRRRAGRRRRRCWSLVGRGPGGIPRPRLPRSADGSPCRRVVSAVRTHQAGDVILPDDTCPSGERDVPAALELEGRGRHAADAYPGYAAGGRSEHAHRRPRSALVVKLPRGRHTSLESRPRRGSPAG
jgi:hypothetical protein